MATHHLLGHRRAFGAHMRYWIRVQTPNGARIVGAMLFGAAAKALVARDRWIGWSAEKRLRYRPRIVNNNRFFILLQVQIPHLASHALALAARRIRMDWQARYGYAPVLLETFVEPPNEGVCYRAANWILVGHTAGRSRQDQHHTCAVTTKSVWMYPLVRDWRRRLFEPLPAPTEEYEWGSRGGAGTARVADRVQGAIGHRV